MSRAPVAAKAAASPGKAASAPVRTAAPGLPVATQVHLGSGERLPVDVKRYFEPRFGADFSNVRLHRDAAGAEAAEAAGAKAFTIGQHIAMGPGRFALGTAAGRQLLAHELAHVMQQRRGGAAPGGHRGTVTEQDASRAGRVAALGAPAIPVRAASGVGIAREEKKDEDRTKLNFGLANRFYNAVLDSPVVPGLAKQGLEGANEWAKRKAEEYGITKEQQQQIVATVVEAVGPPAVAAAQAAVTPPPEKPEVQSPKPVAPKPKPKGQPSATGHFGLPQFPSVVDTSKMSPEGRKSLEDYAQSSAELQIAIREGERLPGLKDDYYDSPDYLDQFVGTPDYNEFSNTVTVRFQDGLSVIIDPRQVDLILGSLEPDKPQSTGASFVYFKREIPSGKILPSSITDQNAPKLMGWFRDNRELLIQKRLMVQAATGTAQVVGKRASNRLMFEMGMPPVNIATQSILQEQVEGDPDAEKALASYNLMQLPIGLASGGLGGARPETEGPLPTGREPIDISHIEPGALELQTYREWLEAQAGMQLSHDAIDVSHISPGELDLQNPQQWLQAQPQPPLSPDAIPVGRASQRIPFQSPRQWLGAQPPWVAPADAIPPIRAPGRLYFQTPQEWLSAATKESMPGTRFPMPEDPNFINNIINQSPGASRNELREAAFLAELDPTANPLQRSAKGFDGYTGGAVQKTWEYHSDTGVPILNYKVDGGTWLSLKEMESIDSVALGPTQTEAKVVELLKDNVKLAMRKAENALNPISNRNRTLFFDTPDGRMGIRIENGRPPDNAVIAVKLPPGIARTPALQSAANQELAAMRSTLEHLPTGTPIEVRLVEAGPAGPKSP